jgi:MFS family permease
LIWTLLLLRLKIDSSYKSKGSTEFKSEPTILLKSFIRFLLSMGLCQMGFVIITIYITSYMVLERGLSEAIASLIFAIGPLIGIISSISAGHLSSRVGDRKFLVMIMIGSAICIISIPFTPTTSILAIAYLFFSFFSNSIWTPMTSITASLTPLNRRGFAYSLSMSTFQLVFVITPPLIATIIELFSFWVMFPLSSLLIIVSIFALRMSTIRSHILIPNK